MSRYQKRSILSLGLMFIASALIIAAVLSGARAMFFSGSEQVVNVDVSKSALLNTAINHSVEMLVRGPLVANENHVSYKMSVSPEKRVLTTYTGYNDTVLNQVVLPNSPAAYEQFVYALDQANFVRGVEYTGADNDTRGICSVGRVYYFTVVQDGKSVKTLWSSSCTDATGSLRAKVVDLRNLFSSQFTAEANDLVTKLNIL